MSDGGAALEPGGAAAEQLEARASCRDDVRVSGLGVLLNNHGQVTVARAARLAEALGDALREWEGRAAEAAVRRALTTSQALGIALAAIRAHLGLLARCGDSLSSRLGVDR